MNKQYVLKTSEDDETVAYLYLPKHPKKTVAGIIKKSIHLSDFIEELPNKTPDIIFDFDDEGDIIGIEFI
ncbi:DUF2283 domain-containing protein [Terasakiella sp. A23]|uniref:DUF2283 domain-containing protein n=1 Tax=Terasakiella sp. FCG-A23 TaxID=3080561 RepID=UPI0029544764|nr:DUF2283 domain-containing protein [Terasakiella sp. A23]MDV7341752.1 DUF2283 domain-containing protein [Terasakiella sp. A23]